MKKVGDFWLPDRDRYANPKLLKSRVELYHYQYLKLKKHIRHTDLYVDIGANFGHTSIPFADMFKEIYCFEITPSNYECLVKNTEPYKNIKCFPLGLSDSIKEVEVMEYPTAGSVNTIVDTRLARSERGKAVKRTVVPLDDILPYQVAGLIKIDVEGHEVQVIEGAKEFIARSRGVAHIESVDTKEEVKEAMFKLGWKYILRDGFHDLIFKKRD